MDPMLSKNSQVEKKKISSFKRQLLKGKWSQNASTNKFSPRDDQGMRSGQNNTCGRGGNELEGKQRMCSAERGPLRGMGSLQKLPLTCPLKHLCSRETAPSNSDPVVQTLQPHGYAGYVHWFMASLLTLTLLGRRFFATTEDKMGERVQRDTSPPFVLCGAKNIFVLHKYQNE